VSTCKNYAHHFWSSQILKSFTIFCAARTDSSPTTGVLITCECKNYGCITREAQDICIYKIRGILNVDLEINLGYLRLFPTLKFASY
jgi:hypothetical protein